VRVPGGPEELEAAWVAAAARLPGVSGIRVERIGVGFGLDGTIARVRLEGASGLPPTLVAKWCGAGPGATEARFLEEVGPLLEIGLPSLLGAVVDGEADRAILLLDDVAPARQGDVLLGAAPGDAEALVLQLARVHARFWERTAEPAVSWLPDWGGHGESRAARTAEALPRFLAEHGERLPAVAIREAERLPARLAGVLEELRAAPRTLVHADLHGDNLLFRADGAPVILDWTDASLGPCAVDFARVLVDVLKPPERRALGDGLAARYADAIAEHGVRGYGADRLRQDADRVALVLFAAAIRWAGGPERPNRVIPRIVPIIRTVVDNTAAAVVDAATR